MANPITWRNVNGPDFSGGNLISSGVSDIQSGLAGLQNILGTQARQEQETWQRVKEANTLNALNQVNQIRSVEQLDATQAADLINPYGAQVNAQAVMDALKGQRGVIADDMQTEDSITSYTEKVKYGPIASQAALLIQQGRIQEAAPLLQELQGTSYAEQLGGLVQKTNWHNQEVGFKEQELALRRSQLAADQQRLNEPKRESELYNRAAADMDYLINTKGMLPAEAKNEILKVYGKLPGVDVGRLSPRLDVYATGYQLSPEAQLAVQDVTSNVKNARTKYGELLATAKEGVAQKVGYNPVMQEQIDNHALKPNSFAIGDGEGQMPKSEVDDANKTLASQTLSPLTVGEIAWLAQNPDSGPLGIGTKYKLDAIIAQRKANESYKERINGLQNIFNKEDTALAKKEQEAIDSITRHYLAPNAHPKGAKAIEDVNTAITNSGVTLTNTFGKVVDGPERERQKEEELKAAKKREEALMGQLAQASANKGYQQQNSGGQAYSYQTANLPGVNDAPEAKELRANIAQRQFVTNYRPKTPKDWDEVKVFVAKYIQQNDRYAPMKLKALDAAVDKAKNGDSSNFMRFFGDDLEKYATTIYPNQKAGKK